MNTLLSIFSFCPPRDRLQPTWWQLSLPLGRVTHLQS